MAENNSKSSAEDDVLDFAAEEEPRTEESSSEPWKLLVVDDESEVHNVTDLALSGMQVADRPLQLLHAHSGRQSCEMMREHPDIAIILMDVVMETEHAGLDAVKTIREEIGNHFVRIILRTGQPGQAPEREVITRYDINDYKEKTELTADKLFTAIYTSLCAYRDLQALDEARRGLEKILEAASSLFELQPRRSFFQGVLQQLTGFLSIAGSAVLLRVDQAGDDEPRVAAATGWLSGSTGRPMSQVLSAGAIERIQRAIQTGLPHSAADHYTGYFTAGAGSSCVLYMPLDAPLSVAQKGLADNFCEHLAVVLDNFEQLR